MAVLLLDAVKYVSNLQPKLKVKLADPDIVSNPSEYQKLAQSVSELDEVVDLYCC